MIFNCFSIFIYLLTITLIGFIIKVNKDTHIIKEKGSQKHMLLEKQYVLENVDFKVVSKTIDSSNAKAEMESFIQPFDLSEGPLLRVMYLATEKEDHLLIDMHHIITDGTSQGILEREFWQLYKGESLPTLDYQQ